MEIAAMLLPMHEMTMTSHSTYIRQKNDYKQCLMISYGTLALHTSSHSPQEGWAKPSAPPDLIQD